MKLSDAQIEPGLRIYAIGDVHGCSEELRTLISLINEYESLSPCERYRIIFLGDYLDRGPDNFGAIETLIDLKKSSRDCVFLMGNHDERVLTFMKNPTMVWDGMMKWGGAKTLADYGIVPGPGESEASVSNRFAEAIPSDHHEFLQALEPCCSEGDYFFCHAGIRPGVPIEDQSAHDLMWIRYDFLDYDEPHEKVVIHGHTPVEEPEIRENRINVDTHCYATGTLTAVVLEEGTHRFIQTRDAFSVPESRVN